MSEIYLYGINIQQVNGNPTWIADIIILWQKLTYISCKFILFKKKKNLDGKPIEENFTIKNFRKKIQL